MYRNTLSRLTSCSLLAMALTACNRDSDKDRISWTLVWQDEFSGNSLSSDWSYDTGTAVSGWGNNQLQYYLEGSSNASVGNGYLTITARKEDYSGSAYTSARVKTENVQSFSYGKIEARIKVPVAKGMWPAFSMLGSDFSTSGWPACGEIDVMEHINTENRIYGTAHWLDSSEQHQYRTGGTDFSDLSGWHTYAIEWDEQRIRWLLDGDDYYSLDISGRDAFQKDFFLVLNLAVGGDWPGEDVDASALPAQMLVDYVRVYKADEQE